MVFVDVSFPEYFITLQTIRRSELHMFPLRGGLHILYRVLLANIRFIGAYPCSRCLVRKDEVHLMGTKTDMANRKKKKRIDNWTHLVFPMQKACKKMFQRGLGVGSDAVQVTLESQSITTTIVSVCFHSLSEDLLRTRQQSAFTTRLMNNFKLFNAYQIFGIDLLHEVEVGTWKALFIHLLRLLVALGDDVVTKFNKRYILGLSFVIYTDAILATIVSRPSGVESSARSAEIP